MIRTGQMSRSGARWLATATAGSLAAFGVCAVSQSGALASSTSVPTWTQQSPASGPRGLFGAATAAPAFMPAARSFGDANHAASTSTTFIEVVKQ